MMWNEIGWRAKLKRRRENRAQILRGVSVMWARRGVLTGFGGDNPQLEIRLRSQARCGPAPYTLTLFKTYIADFPTLFNPIKTGGGGAFRTPLRQNRDNSYTERAMTFKFSDFS